MAVFSKMLVILGPTASGKSDLALELARRTGAHLLSVDSMQVYRHMDIGTAKPSTAERAATPHHLIDVVDPDRTFTVARFVELADAVISDAQRQRIPLIAAGGTPLYYKSLFEGLFDGPPADEPLRARLRELGNEELYRRLGQIDPEAAARIHVNDTKRLVRALEVYELTGRPISSFQTEWSAPRSRHDAAWIGIHWDKELLNRRINARVKSMLTAGWLDETRALLDRFVTLSKTASEATGYHELIEHLLGRVSLDDAVEQIKIGTRQLARRQMKWFRKWPQVKWIDGQLALEEKLGRAMEIWQETAGRA